MKDKLTGTDLLILCMVLVWGINYPLIKLVLYQFLPMSFNILRFSLASLLLLFIVRLFQPKGFRFSRADLPRLFLLAILGNTTYQLLFIYGINKTTASSASLIAATIPIFTGIFSALLRYERIRLIGWVGISCSFLGIFLIIKGKGRGDPLLVGETVGDVMILVSTLSWALYTVLAKPMLKKYPPLILTSYAMIIGTIFLYPFAISDLKQQDWGRITTSGWLILGYSFSLAIALGYVIWYRGVGRIGGVRTAVYSNLTPIFAIIFSFLILREELSYTQLIGGLVVGLGVYLVRFRRGIEQV